MLAGGRGRAVRRAAVALVAAGLLVAGAAPASAHDALVSSTPADGATVPAPPPSVVLTFEEPPLALGAQVVVTGPGGAVVSTGTPQLAQEVLTEQLDGDLPAGRYAVSWRVTSDDGHPVSGTFAYTATAGASPSPAPSPSASPAPASGTSGAAAGSRSPSTNWLPWAGSGAVLAAAAAVSLVRRRRRPAA